MAYEKLNLTDGTVLRAEDVAHVENGIAANAASYTKLDLKDGTVLKAEHMAHIEDGILASGGGLTEEIKEFNQIPTKVKEFIENVTYSASDYTTSSIETYYQGNQNNGRPESISLPLPTEYVSASLPIDSIDGNSNIAYRFTEQGESVKIFNLTPEVNSKVQMKDADDGILKAYILKPHGLVRMINTEYPVNMRDLGGWSTYNGSTKAGTVKYGKLYRSADIYPGAKDAERKILVEQLGIGAELSLVGNEVDYTESPIGSDILYCRPAEYVWYNLTDEATWTEILRFVFDCVKRNIPLVFHCSAGCDRTGTVACILEALLGMSQSDIDKDYELSSFTGEGYVRLRTSNNWKSLINAINAKSGSSFNEKVINWVMTLGITGAEIDAFRATMVDGTMPTVGEVGLVTVSKTTGGAIFSNDASSVRKYQPYECEITPPAGMLLKSVVVTMGGKDVSNTYASGLFVPNGETSISKAGKFDVTNYSVVNVTIPTATKYSVGYTLNNSSTSCLLAAATEFSSYGTIITPTDGYRIKTITVTMGGTDITDSVVVGKEV